MLGTILALLGSFMGVFVVFKYIILMQLRLDARSFKTLFSLIRQNRKFVLYEQLVADSEYPEIFCAMCSINGCPFFLIDHKEQFMTAGFQGKELVTTLTCFRWQYKRLYNYLTVKLKALELNIGVPVELVLPYYNDRIGMLKHPTGEPKLDPEVWQDIEQEVAEVFAGKRPRTGAILYGPPGNGKTCFCKYLATKYKVPIKLLTFSPDFTNHKIMSMFARIEGPCIVLLEDFDNYFDGRKCILGTQNNSIMFSFDVILNGLDGVYNTYENVVFIMTANDIDKIDSAIKCRPSRFKYVRKFANPDAAIRKKLLSIETPFAEDLNLDQLMRVNEYLESGLSVVTAIGNVKEIDHAEIQKMAFSSFLLRQSENSPGTPEDDWFSVVNGKKVTL
jgi:hypothetical protein